MNLGDIAQALDGYLIGDAALTVDNVIDLESSTESSLTFILDKRKLELLSTVKAGVIVTFAELSTDIPQIIVTSPREALAKAIALFHPVPLLENSDIASTAQIDPSASLGRGLSIGHHVVIGKNCRIGNHCVIHPNVTLYDNVTLGENVILHSGSVLGSDGFGFYPKNGGWTKIPHIGSVVIGDDVEIGANSTIDRGCLGETVIGQGTKIDNLVHVAHNVNIGRDCVVAAHTGMLGSARIGNNVQVGGQTGIAAVKVGDNSVIAAKSGVTRDVKPGSFVSGFPAWDHKAELKKEAFIRKQSKASGGA